MPRRKYAWEKLSDEQLLKQRLSSLRVKVEGTWLEDCLGALNEELQARGIRLRPHTWISSEWFSPADVPGIAIPFYLAHPRLMKLEKKMMLEVEGGTWSECMAILRHETGHAVQHAYQFQRRRRWQQLFGPSSKHYPLYYRPNPASRRYVQHLRRWYAQSHPDEDFAETFAVWLRPRSNWRTRYAGWPALKKLEYVDELMGEIAGKRPPVMTRERTDPLSHAEPDAWRALPEKAGVLRVQAAEDLRPRPLPSFLRRSTAPAGAAGCGLHQAAPRANQAAGRAMDGREPAHARCRS